MARLVDCAADGAAAIPRLNAMGEIADFPEVLLVLSRVFAGLGFWTFLPGSPSILESIRVS